MDQIKTIIIIILAACLLKMCVRKKDVVTETKIEYIKGKPDTTYITKTVVKERILPSTVTVIRDTINDTLVIDAREYITVHEDSVLSIRLKQIVQGTLFHTDLEYDITYPTITRVDTVKKTETIYPSGVFMSAQLGLGVVLPSINYTNKNYQFSLGYNIPSNSPVVGIGVKLFPLK
jgi:hypothetical protein